MGLLVSVRPAPPPALITWRTGPSFGVGDSLVLALYTAIVAVTIPFHEPWSDEAQAWLIARDNSFWEIYHHRLHYEGAPAVWHFLLRLFHLAGGSWRLVDWFGAVFAISGTYVFLRWSPFPPLLRFSLPFTFFLQYQYAIIARSYVLFPLLVWSVCALFGQRPRRPLWFVLAAGLLASLSLQGFIASIFFSFLYFRKLRREQQPRLRLSLALLAASWAVAIYPAIPAPDVSFAVGGQVSSGFVHTTLVRLIGQMPEHPIPPRPPRNVITSNSNETAPAHRVPPPAWTRAPRYRLAWEADGRYSPLPEIPRVILENVLSLLAQVTWAISDSNLLACFFLAACAVWLFVRGQLATLLPWAAIVLAGTILWVADHHTGLALISLFGGLWIANDDGRGNSVPAWVEQTFVYLFFLVVLLQIGWTATTVWRDIRGNYDPGPQTARYLKSLPPGTSMAAFGFTSTSTQPWFPVNPFENLDAANWTWSSNVDVNGHDLQTIARHPRMVLYSWENSGSSPMRNQWVPQNFITAQPDDFIYHDLLESGYRVTHQFCGERFSRFGSSFRDCNLMMEPVDQAQPAP